MNQNNDSFFQLQAFGADGSNPVSLKDAVMEAEKGNFLPDLESSTIYIKAPEPEYSELQEWQNCGNLGRIAIQLSAVIERVEANDIALMKEDNEEEPGYYSPYWLFNPAADKIAISCFVLKSAEFALTIPVHAEGVPDSSPERVKSLYARIKASLGTSEDMAYEFQNLELPKSELLNLIRQDVGRARRLYEIFGIEMIWQNSYTQEYVDLLNKLH